MTIITEGNTFVLCMDNILNPIFNPRPNYIPGFINPNPIGPPRPYPALGIQEPKGGHPKPNPKPNFGDPGL